MSTRVIPLVAAVVLVSVGGARAAAPTGRQEPTVFLAGSCTAVPVHQRAVVLPAHCVVAPRKQPAVLERVDAHGRLVVAARVRHCTPHPQYNVALHDHDLAVCELEQPLAAKDVVPIGDAAPPTTAERSTVSVLGFRTGAPAQPAGQAGPQLMHGRLIQLRTAATALIRTEERPTCHGDSGAAVHMGGGATPLRLLGIVVGADGVECRGLTVAVRLAHHRAWIEQAGGLSRNRR